LAFVQGEGRVLVTHDDDFLTIASARDDHPGIAYVSPARHEIAVWGMMSIRWRRSWVGLW
jgi:hypothetical protein